MQTTTDSIYNWLMFSNKKDVMYLLNLSVSVEDNVKITNEQFTCKDEWGHIHKIIHQTKVWNIYSEHFWSIVWFSVPGQNSTRNSIEASDWDDSGEKWIAPSTGRAVSGLHIRAGIHKQERVTSPHWYDRIGRLVSWLKYLSF